MAAVDHGLVAQNYTGCKGEQKGILWRKRKSGKIQSTRKIWDGEARPRIRGVGGGLQGGGEGLG